jgi:hypothetical protein
MTREVVPQVSTKKKGQALRLKPCPRRIQRLIHGANQIVAQFDLGETIPSMPAEFLRFRNLFSSNAKEGIEDTWVAYSDTPEGRKKRKEWNVYRALYLPHFRPLSTRNGKPDEQAIRRFEKRMRYLAQAYTIVKTFTFLRIDPTVLKSQGEWNPIWIEVPIHSHVESRQVLEKRRRHGPRQKWRVSMMPNPLFDDLQGVDADRIRQCRYCFRFFWAGRMDQTECSHRCNNILRQKDFREKDFREKKNERRREKRALAKLQREREFVPKAPPAPTTHRRKPILPGERKCRVPKS